METVTRIRKIYKPLSLSVSVKASGAALAQQYNQYEDTITPNRSTDNPTVLTPYVWATTGDNEPSWENRNVAGMLQEVRWFANNVDIMAAGTGDSNPWAKAGSYLFEIVQSADDTNGTLRIWKNFAAEEQYTMRMEAKFVDPRTKQVHIVKTDSVDMTCKALGENEWDFSVVHDVNIRYCPVYDNLKLYDYLVASDQLPTSKTRADYADATAYDLSVLLLVTHGHNKITPDSSVTFRILDHLNEHAEVSPENTLFITELDNTHIRFDLRYMPEDTLVLDVQMLVDGKLQSQEQLTFTRYYPAISATPTNLTDIDLTAATRHDKALVTFNGAKVEYPEAFLRLEWSAKANETDAWTPQGFGEEVTINQSALSPTNDLFVKLTYRIKSGLIPISAPLANDEVALIENVNGKIIVTDNLK